MSTGGSVTCANFKKIQLDHLIDVILEAGGDADHPACCIADTYRANNMQDYININHTELDVMTLTKMNSTDQVIISSELKK